MAYPGQRYRQKQNQPRNVPQNRPPVYQNGYGAPPMQPQPQMPYRAQPHPGLPNYAGPPPNYTQQRQPPRGHNIKNSPLNYPQQIPPQYLPRGIPQQSGAPRPNNTSVMKPHQMGRQQQPMSHVQHQVHQNIGGPQIMLKRQASLLRSAYPNSVLSRVFLNNGNLSSDNNGNNNGGLITVSSDLFEPIQQCQVVYTFEYETTALAEAVSSSEFEHNKTSELEQRENIRSANLEEEKLRKIATVSSVTTQSEDFSRALLEKVNWDLQAALANAFSSSSNVLEGVDMNDDDNNTIDVSSNNTNDHNPFESNFNSNMTITVVFTDGRQFTWVFNANDTFWTLYERILQNRYEYGAKRFNFRLTNGRELGEDHFDESLNSCGLNPSGTVYIIDL